MLFTIAAYEERSFLVPQPVPPDDQFVEASLGRVSDAPGGVRVATPERDDAAR